MDVLHFLKLNHDRVRESLQLHGESLESDHFTNQFLTLSCDLRVHFQLVRDYLYPELQGLSEALGSLVEASEARITSIEDQLVKLESAVLAHVDSLDELLLLLVKLRESVLAHFSQEEQGLMPKMRQIIRTEEREDLGQVFLDVKEEVTANVIGRQGEARNIELRMA